MAWFDGLAPRAPSPRTGLRGIAARLAAAALAGVSLLFGAAGAGAETTQRLKLPAVAEPGRPAPHPIARLEASADGARLLVVRRDAGHPFAYALLDLASGKPLWQAQDACCGGSPPWDVLLAPRGGAVALLYPEGGAPIRYRLLGGPPLHDFTGGAWTADGGWLGGSMGSFDADGTRRGSPVPGAKEVADVLFSPGPTADSLRFVHGGVRYVWDGRRAPRKEAPWPCARAAAERNLDGPQASPVRWSPDGRFVAWSPRAEPERVLVCDSRDGAEVALVQPGGEVRGLAFSGPAEIVYVADGAVRRRTLPAGAPVPVPFRAPGKGEAPTAVAATLAPPALFIGTSLGQVYRLAL